MFCMGSGLSRGRGPQPSKGDAECGWRLLYETGWLEAVPQGLVGSNCEGHGGEKAAGWVGGWGSELPLAIATAVQEDLRPSVPPVLSLGRQVGCLQPNGRLRH